MRSALEQRRIPFLLVLIGALLLLLRSAVFERGEGTIPLGCAAIGPLALLLGIVGLVNPLIVDAIGARRKSLPMALRVTGGVCVVVSLLISGVLVVFRVY